MPEQGPATEADWVTEGDSPLRAYAAEAEVPPPLVEAWSYNASAGFGPGSAMLLGDYVLAATRNGEVHAVELDTGKRLNMSGFGDAIEGMPAIDDGILYVPVAWGRRAIIAYDLRRGSTVWAHRHPPIEAGLLVLDGAVIGVDVEGNVRAYDKAEGDTLWTYALGAERLVRAAPLFVDGRVIVADDAGTLTALTPGGDEAWARTLSAPVLATPASDGARLYVPTTRGDLYALDAASGAELWRHELGHDEVYLTTPAVTPSYLVVAGSDGVVRGLDPASGRELWTHAAEEAVRAAPLVAGDHAYVATMEPRLLALDVHTGTPAWSTTLDGRIKSAMAARDGQLIVLTEEKRVILFRPEDPQYATTED